ncbi:hypothetical protein PVAP13_5KG076900 [Panicum virgatum]|uniref:Uncharacterized protein n=1 Tax=Panicum virgatum TaxID=38727 RepID=A0A8T0SEH5_PANVG|nr:hypothetical protein PVAP13_5KG076900 [Panicum virgatum]
MHKAECLIKHGKTKDGSSTRSLDYLTMEQAAHGISDGMYTYKHRCEGGVDIHDIVVKKSRFRILLYHIGTICLLMTVCRILLAKETLGLGSLWSISFAGVIAKWLRCDPVKKESLVIMPTFGVQLEQHFWRYGGTSLEFNMGAFKFIHAFSIYCLSNAIPREPEQL